jgi:hypothetical protein
MSSHPTGLNLPRAMARDLGTGLQVILCNLSIAMEVIEKYTATPNQSSVPRASFQ